MEALPQRFFKHALKCEQCSKHPDNPCAIGTLIMSAAASVAIISAQQGAQAAGADAKKTTNTEGGAE